MENQQRLIDADALISRALEEKRFVFTMYDLINNEYIVETVYKDLADFINEAPTINAEPVRHGRWEGTDFDGYADGNPVYYLWQCSCCHEEYERDGLPPWYDYCPNCGAKMDGGAENA